MITKFCKHCQQNLPATLEYFYKHPGYKGKQSLFHICKKCKRFKNAQAPKKKLTPEQKARKNLKQRISYAKLRGIQSNGEYIKRKATIITPEVLNQKRLSQNKRVREYAFRNREKIKNKRIAENKRRLSLGLPTLAQEAYIKQSSKPGFKEKRRLKQQRYFKQRILRDPSYKLQRRMFALVWSSLRSKESKTIEKRLGYSCSQLRRHLEQNFKEGMLWSNYGVNGWHIDHIQPVSSFDIKNPKKLRECWRLENLQPLWAKENRLKGNKIIC